MKVFSTMQHIHFIRSLALFLPALTLSACGSLERMENIGRPPPLSAIESPKEKKGYKPVRMPMPPRVVSVHNPHSLWRTGSRAFFKDQRARQVGDIVTANVRITDKAKLNNKTARSRKGDEGGSVDALFGFTGPIKRVLKNTDTTTTAKLNSSSSSEGEGTVDRAENLSITMAAVIMQVLPNGNMVVEGKQEVRVNFEVRELIVAGIVRPEDISADNTIDSTKIAEARISYGGRGQITDVQQPRYGQQVLDILLPF
jgi:flagellar L-ring protein precursor FlgH